MRASRRGTHHRRNPLDGPISRHGLVNFVHAHVIELVTAIYLLYILLGTLIPFDFTLGGSHAQGRSLLGLGDMQARLPDLLSNIGLYLPLGLLLQISLVRLLGNSWISVVGAIAAAAAVSVAVESVQLLSPTRISSVVDFTANLTGASAGAILALLCRFPERRMLDALWDELRRDRHASLVKVAVALLVIGGMAPYTPTVSVNRLLSAARQSTFVPFSQTTELAAQARKAELDGQPDVAAACQRDRIFLWARWAAEALSFAVLGWLLHRLLRERHLFKPHAALGLAIYLISLLAIALSVAQIAIMSRGFHVTDIMMRWLGGLAGYGLAEHLLTRWTTEGTDISRGIWRIARPAAIMAILLVLLTDLAPFIFDFSPGRATQRLESSEVLPFYSYYVGRFDRVCADFWGKSMRFAFLGISLWMCWRHRLQRSLELRAAGIAFIVMLFSLAIESAQIFLRSRVTCLTDVLTAPLAAWVGVILAQYAADFYRHATTARPTPTVDTDERRHRFTPTDALVATLIPDNLAQAGEHARSQHADERE